MGFLQDKRVLVTGVASNRSIAYGVAQAMHREGAQIALTYQTEKLKSRVEDLAAKCGSEVVLPLDVASDAQIEAAFRDLSGQWDGLDAIVHSIGYAPREQLEGEYIDAVTREGFAIAHDISSYSFAALAKAGRGMMQGRNGSLLTMTYLGAVRTVPNYNVMGVAKATWPPPWVRRAPALMPSPPALFALWLHPVLRTSGPCSSRSQTVPH
jgi:enoyl-[acyl-carrier protein] reductase I